LPSNWLARLDEAARANLPAWVRLRLVKDALALTHEELRALAGPPERSPSTWKNILAGRVISEASSEKSSRSRIDWPELERLREALIATRKFRLPATFFQAPMTLHQVTELLQGVLDRPNVAMRREALRAAVPEFPGLELTWSPEGEALTQDLRAWLSAPTDPPNTAFGLLGEARMGKTVLVSTLVRELPDLTVLWFECAKIQSYEFLLENILIKLLRFDGVSLESGMPNRMGDRMAEIKRRLAKRPNLICVFDGTENLVVDPGYMAERPADELVIEVVRELIANVGVRSIVCSRLPLLLLSNEVRWRPAETPLWLAPTPPADEAPTRLVRLLGRAADIHQKDRFSADEIVDRVLSTADAVQRQLFALVTLLGEEIWIETLRWYCHEALGIPDKEIDPTLTAFWRFCALCQAVALQVHLEPSGRSVDLSSDASLHFKFHDSIMRTAARRLEAGEDPRLARRVHRLIARRAFEVAELQAPAHLRGKTAVGRLVRPAQVIKHLLASADTEAGAGAVGPLPAATKDQFERAEAPEVFLDRTPIGDVLDFCHRYYRRRIDKAGEFDLSRTNGADRPKLDLLMRFFQPGRSVDIAVPALGSDLPRMGVDAIVDILTGIAVAGLNAGALPEADWALDLAAALLETWEQDEGTSPQQAKLYNLVVRARVDLLVRSGRLVEADERCAEMLHPGSDFRRRADLRGIQKMELRHAHVRYLMRGPGEALSILGRLNLNVRTGSVPDLSVVDLTGFSGRVAVGVLFRTLRTQGAAQDASVLSQIKRIHEHNWSRARNRRNDEVALVIEKCMIDLISEAAIVERRDSLIDASRIGPCRDLLESAHRTAWNRGVSPITRLELLMQSARLEYLDERLELALDLIERAENRALVFGYRMRELIADRSRDRTSAPFSHPAQWAAFAYIGLD
jgi:hypothetical protein